MHWFLSSDLKQMTYLHTNKICLKVEVRLTMVLTRLGFLSEQSGSLGSSL